MRWHARLRWILAAAVVVGTSLPAPARACSGAVTFHHGGCEGPDDLAWFRIEVLSREGYTVEWGTGDPDLELVCDPPGDPDCTGVTFECPDCTGGTAVSPVDLHAHVLDPEGTSCWFFTGFDPCGAEEDDGPVATRATLCHLPAVHGAPGASVPAVLLLLSGLAAARRRG